MFRVTFANGNVHRFIDYGDDISTLVDDCLDLWVPVEGVIIKVERVSNFNEL